MNAATYTPPADIDARRSRALVIGVAALAVCAVGFVINRDQFFRAWLIGYMLWLGVALGSMGLMMIHHLSGGAWGMVVRRVWEASSRTLPLLTILFIPVVLGMSSLYPWMHTELMQADPILRHKATHYLTRNWFLVRAAVYWRRCPSQALLYSFWTSSGAPSAWRIGQLLQFSMASSGPSSPPQRSTHRSQPRSSK